MAITVLCKWRMVVLVLVLVVALLLVAAGVVAAAAAGGGAFDISLMIRFENLIALGYLNGMQAEPV